MDEHEERGLERIGDLLRDIEDVVEVSGHSMRIGERYIGRSRDLDRDAAQPAAAGGIWQQVLREQRV